MKGSTEWTDFILKPFNPKDDYNMFQLSQHPGVQSYEWKNDLNNDKIHKFVNKWKITMPLLSWDYTIFIVPGKIFFYCDGVYTIFIVVLIFANFPRRINSRIWKSRDYYYYNSAIKEKRKFANSKLRENFQNLKFAKIWTHKNDQIYSIRFFDTQRAVESVLL